jgi:hypothetical protein
MNEENILESVSTPLDKPDLFGDLSTASVEPVIEYRTDIDVPLEGNDD